MKAIVAIEPIGPPFINAVFPPFTPARKYGLSEIPVAYDPPIQSASDLQTSVVSSSTNYTCFEQAAPARKMINLQNIPVLMVTSQSGYHSVYDTCSANFLKQAGVPVDAVALPTVGIFGNGHMMFMEKNNIEIVNGVIQPWLRKSFL